MLSIDLSGRVALVTGAGQSIGEGIATLLAEHGAEVWVNDIVEERATAVAAAIGGRAAVFDVTDRDAVVAAVGEIGAVDILVNNAGNAGATPMVPTPFAQLPEGGWAGPLAVNLDGIFHTAHAVLPQMIERGGGRIVTISSAAGTIGSSIGVAPYSAAKAGAESFMRALAAENAAHGITCNSVALGLMDTTSGTEHTARLAATVPLGRLGQPGDVAPVVAFLASDAGAWITGQTWHVNGGTTMT